MQYSTAYLTILKFPSTRKHLQHTQLYCPLPLRRARAAGWESRNLVWAVHNIFEVVTSYLWLTFTDLASAMKRHYKVSPVSLRPPGCAGFFGGMWLNPSPPLFFLNIENGKHPCWNHQYSLCFHPKAPAHKRQDGRTCGKARTSLSTTASKSQTKTWPWILIGCTWTSTLTEAVHLLRSLLTSLLFLISGKSSSLRSLTTAVYNYSH